MNLEEFIADHYEDGEVYSEDKGVKFVKVHCDEYTEHKTVTFTEVHQLILDDSPTDEYFEIATDRDNVGYWGDASSYPPVFRKVQRVEKLVPTVFWVDV